MVKQFKIFSVMALAAIISACSGGPEKGVDYADVDFEVLSKLDQEVVFIFPETQSSKSIEILNFLYEEVGKDNVKVIPIVSDDLKSRVDAIGEAFSSKQVSQTSMKMAAFPAMILADVEHPNESHLASYWMYYDQMFHQGGFESYYDKFSPLMAEGKMIDDLFEDVVPVWFGRKVNQKEALNSEGAKLWLEFIKAHGKSEALGDRKDPVIVINGETLILSKDKEFDSIKSTYLELI